MEWNERLQEIIDYIEDHLQYREEPINETEISKIAGCSYSFFLKVFSYMNGISFAEYIRFRKLTLAGYDLKSTNDRVVDISYKYGYNSPTSFTKAFIQFHGISPSEARNTNIALQIYPKMQIAKKQDYTWRIEHHQQMRCIGYKTVVSSLHDKAASEIPAFIHTCQTNGIFAKLLSLDTASRKGMFSMFDSFDNTCKQMEYTIMVQSTHSVQEPFHEITIPAVSWAIFDCRGPVPKSIQDGWLYLRNEWLIKYPFRHATCPELEWYSRGNTYDKNYLSQIWIPIIEGEIV